MIEGQEGVTWSSGGPSRPPVRGTATRRCSARTTTCRSWTAPSGGRSTRGRRSPLWRPSSRLRLGTLVSPVTFRHPAVLAKSVATVDQVSGGRVELGIGAGWPRQSTAPRLPARPAHADGRHGGADGDRGPLVRGRALLVPGRALRDRMSSTRGWPLLLDHAGHRGRPRRPAQSRAGRSVGGRVQHLQRIGRRDPRAAGRLRAGLAGGRPRPRCVPLQRDGGHPRRRRRGGPARAPPGLRGGRAGSARRSSTACAPPAWPARSTRRRSSCASSRPLEYSHDAAARVARGRRGGRG